MKIVQFEDFFHPDAGYNINILSKYLSKFGHEVIIFTSEIEKSPTHLKTFFDCSNIEDKDRIYEQKYNVKIYRVNTYFYFSSRAVVTPKLFGLMKQLSPDIVYIHGNDTFVGILSTIYFRNRRVPIIYDSSMVEMASKNRFNKQFRLFYRKFITPLILKKGYKVIRTQDDDYVQKHLGVPLSLSPFISLGVDTDLFYPSKTKSKLRYDLNLPINSFIIVYAGKLDYSKGVDLLMKAWETGVQNGLSLFLLIIGNVNPEVEKDFRLFEKVNKASILHLKTLSYSSLCKYYQASDLAIFPRQISLSFYNAQACGLPVIAEKNNVNSSRLSHGNGMTFSYGDYNDLISKIAFIAQMEKKNYLKMSKNSLELIKNHYDYNVLVHSYLSLFSSEIERQNSK